MRAAIYARYSTDLQNAASIADQVRVCRKLCEANGWQVVEIFADEAISGATDQRPGFQQLLRSAMNGAIDVIVAEALDRLSRDQEHIAGLHKRMAYSGVQIVTKAEGEISELHVGLNGTMSALFLRQLAQKTRRGLEGRVRAGKSAGGISYGYKAVRQLLPDGSQTRGDRTIHPEEAVIVQRIFERFASGHSARAIAIELNRDRIPPPRGKGGKPGATWSFSTISGNWKRGTGILNNELYIGRLVWNRQNFVKDPDTGKRQARPNPPEDLIIEDVPHLRIIDDELWERVKKIQHGVRKRIRAEDRPNAYGAARRPTYLLSGLLKCGCCGANYILVNALKYGCSANRNRGTCPNRATIRRAEVETRVLDGLKDHLLHPDLLAAFVEEFQREMRKEQHSSETERKTAEARLTKLEKEISNLIDAVANGMFHQSMTERLQALEDEKLTLRAKLDQLPEPLPVTLHPAMAEIYRAKVATLIEALNADGTRNEAADILRGLIAEIRMLPREGGGHDIELYGELGAILGLGEPRNDKPRLVVGGVSNSMVAGVGFEPTTFRL
ncbi:recombinase family protein [Sedimentimonas flavescens]|uniref:Recombinase family protein n=1 Tax=Sedimentimonas flavescens TaxID=2851012 RepID=A0ABT3A2Z5_9RHOB|nr:recombinase family protein [Sedimentimonas flavescens]MCV2880370.1 recombinase family protein [Sedimentimonas flavescens]